MNTEICETQNPKPGWARPDGALRYAPFGRTTLYDLIRRNLIESYVIGKPGKSAIQAVTPSQIYQWEGLGPDVELSATT